MANANDVEHEDAKIRRSGKDTNNSDED